MLKLIACSAALALAGAIPGAAQISSSLFRHHFITDDIPQTKPFTWGYGTPALADFDGDGDLDFAFSTRLEKLYWFENAGGKKWIRHEAGEVALGQLGAATLDVDRDGRPDIVTGGYWYRNPDNPRSAPFERFQYDSRIKSEIHDFALADVDGDGRKDIVALGDKEGLFWYRAPRDPKRDADWDRTVITLAVLDSADDIHGGIAPNGVADLDKDGDPDVVLPDRWLENRAAGTDWVRHPLPFGKRGPWGLSCRSWVADLDRDGDNDIVVTDSDQKESRGAILRNDGKKPPSFSVEFLPKVVPGARGSFHSLAVADFDGDGDLDVFTQEQEDTSILPSGADPRAYIWENLDGKGRRWAEGVILDGKLGGHDVIVGDIDGDGDPDLASKIWYRWPGNANQGRFHANYFENLARGGGKRR